MFQRAKSPGSSCQQKCVFLTFEELLSEHRVHDKDHQKIREIVMANSYNASGSGSGIERAVNLENRETERLIGSDKVEGTNVVRPNGETIGEIERVMIDKRSGQVAYAVMSFGGFLGIGEDYFPLPWSMLTYDENLDGYVVDLTESQLSGAPKIHETDNDNKWADRKWGRSVHDYYGAQPYWGM
jgi:hypothetical protein